MNWDTAVKVLKNSEDHGNVEHEEKYAAALFIANEAGIDDVDWIYEGTWPGNETPESIKEEHDELMTQLETDGEAA